MIRFHAIAMIIIVNASNRLIEIHTHSDQDASIVSSPGPPEFDRSEFPQELDSNEISLEEPQLEFVQQPSYICCTNPQLAIEEEFEDFSFCVAVHNDPTPAWKRIWKKRGKYAAFGLISGAAVGYAYAVDPFGICSVTLKSVGYMPEPQTSLQIAEWTCGCSWYNCVVCSATRPCKRFGTPSEFFSCM